MPREKENFRDELEQLLSFFGEKRVLTAVDVSRYTGRTPQWCRKAYGIEPYKGISVVGLARKLS